METRGLYSLDVSFLSYLLTIFYFLNYIFRSIFISRSYPKLRLGVGIARVRIRLVGIKRAPPTLSLVRELKCMADYRTLGLPNPRIIDT